MPLTLPNEVKTNFDEFLKGVGALVKDATTLNVVTVKGNLSINMNALPGTDPTKVDLSKLEEVMTKKGVNGDLNGSLTIVAQTVIKLDHDSYTYVKENLQEDDKVLLEAHKNMIQSSLEGRQAFVEFVKKLIVG